LKNYGLLKQLFTSAAWMVEHNFSSSGSRKKPSTKTYKTPNQTNKTQAKETSSAKAAGIQVRWCWNTSLLEHLDKYM